MRNRVRPLVLPTFGLLLLTLTSAAHAQEPLFTSQVRSAQGDGWRVMVNVDGLLTAPELLTFELPTGETVWARQDHFEVDGSFVDDEGDVRETFRWWGKTDDGEDVLLNGVGNQVAGTVMLQSGMYRLQPTGSRQHRWFRAADPEAGCGTDQDVVQRVRSVLESRVAAEATASAVVTGQDTGTEDVAAGKAGPTVDVVMVYSPSARARVGGDAAMLAEIRSDIDYTNRALGNSLIDASVRLLQVEQVNYQADAGSDAGLNWLITNGDGIRRAWGADIVGIIHHVTDYCGIAAYRGIRGNADGGFFLTASNCLGRGTTAHELGHLWGADHDPENAGIAHGTQSFATYPDAYGNFYDGIYRTIMSYSRPCDLGCPKAPYFSNPAVSYLGRPTGTSQRANHRVIRDYSPTVSRYFTSKAGPPAGPTDLTAEVVETASGFEVMLTWTDRASKEGHYELYRATDGGALPRLTRLSKNSERYVDRAVEGRRTYRYQVEAVNLQGSSRSEEVEVEVVALAAQLEVQANLLRAGEPVVFDLRVEGSGRRALWSFTPILGTQATDGLAVTDAASGWGAVHVFDTPGVYEVRVKVQGGHGQEVAANLTLDVRGATPVWTRTASRLQSVIHGPRGGGGVFESQLWLHNAGAAPALVDLAFLARGQDNRTARRRALTLLPGRTLHLPDVVSTLDAEGAGALSVEARANADLHSAAPRVLAFGRSFVERPQGPNGASFGQRVGEEPAELWSDATRWIVGLYDGPEVDDVTEADDGAETGWQATLHGVNLEDRPGRLTLELTDALGRAVGEPAELGLPPQGMRFQRLIQLFPEVRAFQPPFTARVTSNGIRFLASGTLLESGSEDQAFLPGQGELVGPASVQTRLLIPRVVEGPGQFGVTLSTRLLLHNPADVARTLTLELLERGQDNSQPKTATVTVPAGQTREIRAVLPSLFDIDSGAGALALSWQGEGPAPQAAALVFARAEAGERFATRVEARPPTAAATERSIDFGAEQSSRFTSAYGVLSLFERTTRLELILRDGQGVELARRTQNLRPHQHLERSLLGLFEDAAGQLQGVQDLAVETRVLAGGPVLTYLINVNVSGDVFYVPGRGWR